MKLPEANIEKHVKVEVKAPTWLIVLCVFTLLISLASAIFCALALNNAPHQIDAYVQAHKQELKGDTGDVGPEGPPGLTGASGLNGANSYAPTHCYSSELLGSVSTNCY
jgi:hypothetical protein